MARKTKFFCNNIIFINHFAGNNTKVLGNQNLLLMYNFDYSNYLDTYLYSYNLENPFCKMPYTIFRNLYIQNNRMAHPKVNEYL